MARTSPKNAHKINPPAVRMWYDRKRVSIDLSEGDQTHQSFRDECDVNKIIDLHLRTGIVTHLNAGDPQYGEVPDSSLFEAAVAQAEIRSAIENGWEFPEEAPEDPQDDDSAPAEHSAALPEKGAQDAAEAASVTEKGDRGGNLV